MSWSVAVAGVPVEVDAEEECAVRALSGLLSGCPPYPAGAPGGASIVWERAPRPLPRRHPDVRTSDARFWLDGAGVTAAHDAGIVGTLVDSTLRLGGPCAAGDGSRPLRTAVQLPLCQLLGRAGRHVAHAALVQRDGVGIVVVGPSGAGKSTASFAAASSGWEVLADDMTAIGVVHGRVVGWGIPKPLHVPVELLGERPPAGEAIPDDERARVVLPAPTVHTVSGCPVVGVVYVGHATGAATIVPTPTGMAWLQQLLGSFPVAAAPWGSREVFAAAVSVSRLPAVELRHDADPARRVAEAARLLTEIRDDWADRGSGGVQ